MIREMRGKSLVNGNWVYGYYYVVNLITQAPAVPPNPAPEPVVTPQYFILPHNIETNKEQNNKIQVSLTSVGEKIGMIGKNNVAVFDGDIITATIYPFEKYNGLIVFDEVALKYSIQFKLKPNATSDSIFQNMYRPIEYLQYANVAVIGNKTDNPNLI